MNEYLKRLKKEEAELAAKIPSYEKKVKTTWEAYAAARRDPDSEQAKIDELYLSHCEAEQEWHNVIDDRKHTHNTILAIEKMKNGA